MDQTKRHDLWIFDGGTGREIERRGGPFRQPEWSALALYENPDIVRDIHQSFIEAGATAITTNTYACVPFHLGKERYEKDRKWLLELAVKLALQAKGSRTDIQVQVMGSIPPISGSYQPGSFDEAIAGPIIHDFLNAFRGKVDAIILETMGSAQEAKFALEQIEASGVNIPVYLSFYVQSTEEDDTVRLLTGDTLTQAVDILQQSDFLKPERVPLVMVNCCDIRIVEKSLKELGAALKDASPESKFRIGAYPNAFSAPPSEAANVKAREVNENISPRLFQGLAQEWIRDCGATVIGGCCGIGPSHIEAVAALTQHQGSIPTSATTTTLEENLLIKTATTSPKACTIQGCGCGVQVGFGQKIPFFCQPAGITPMDEKAGTVVNGK